MPAASYLQSSFLGGEVSKSVQGQFDNKFYRTWMNTCANFMPMEQAALTRRPGSMHSGATRGGLAGRVFGFDFKQASPYTIEVTTGFMRFRAGPALVMTNDQQAVVSISTANPAKVKTGTHGWSSGDQVMFNSLSADNPLLQNRLFAATVTSSTEFTLTDALTGATIDGSTLGTFNSGNVSRVLEIATSYTDALWPALRVVQADIATLNGSTPGAIVLHGSVKPYMLQVTSAPTATLFATFSFAAASFKDGPYFDPVSSGALVTPSALIGLITLTLTFQAYDAAVAYSTGDFVTASSIGYRSLVDANLGNTPASSPTDWTPVTAGAAVGPNGFTASDIGRLMRLYSEPPLWVSGTVYAAGDPVTYNNVYYKCLTGHTAGATNTPDTTPTDWSISPSSAIWSWGRITAMSTTGLISGTLAGSVNIGDYTFSGGLAAAFDGTPLKASAGCALTDTSTAAAGYYIGKHYAAGAQTISSVTVYPSSDRGLTLYAFSFAYTLNLRAKHTAPASRSDGTLLGTVAVPNPFIKSALTIISNDQATTWEYVWVEVTSVSVFQSVIAQVQFYSATAAGGSAVTFQIAGPPLLYTSAVRVWRMGLYSDTTGWPTCGTYHEGRLWLSGVIGNRIDGSVSNGVSDTGINFAPTNSDGSVAGNNAISYTFNAPDVNPIFWMQPDYQGIVCGTQGGEWLVQATSNNVPLTPTTIQAHRYTKYNCANIEPRKTNLTLAVVQAFKRELLEYFADVYSGRFSAHDLALYAKHLVASGIEEIGYQQELIPTIWSRCGNGTVVGMTYSRTTLVSSQPPDAFGWHRVNLGSGRDVESICIGANSDGTLDSLVMVTNDPATNIRHVEMLSNVFMETDAFADAWFLDDAVRPSSTTTTNVPSAGAPYGGLTLNGLWHLNGATVQVFAAGLDCGQQEIGTAIADFVVASGSVFVPYGDGVSAGSGAGLFTAVFAAAAVAANQIVIGFTYRSDGQMVRANTPAESGARNGPAFGKLRRNQQVALLVNQTAGLSVGTDFDHLFPMKFNKQASGTALAPGQVANGIYRQPLSGSDDFDGMVCWRVTRPLPATICTAGPFDHTKDI